jgi:hypothetical protein
MVKEALMRQVFLLLLLLPLLLLLLSFTYLLTYPREEKLQPTPLVILRSLIFF